MPRPATNTPKDFHLTRIFANTVEYEVVKWSDIGLGADALHKFIQGLQVPGLMACYLVQGGKIIYYAHHVPSTSLDPEREHKTIPDDFVVYGSVSRIMR
jgi:hypothetical protein